MNIWFLLAGLLSLVGALAHGLGGERFILSKLSPEAFPKMPNGDGAQAKAETRMTWHGITVYFAITGVILLLMAFEQIGGRDTLAAIIALHYAAWTIVLGLIPPLTLRDARAALRSPQWVLMLLMAAFTYAGSLT